MKALKILGLAALVLLLVPAVGFGVLMVKPPSARPPSAEKVEITPERLARGKYLAEHVSSCIECHSEHDLQSYASPIIPGTEGNGGGCFDESVGLPGVICAANITPDPTGLGNWTDGEILRAMREGVSRDGHALFPMMPYGAYRSMSDEDARAVVAYLRSMKPISRARPPSSLKFPVSAFIKLAPKPLEGEVKAPPASDVLAYGRYLTTIAGCADCHTPNDKGTPKPGLELAGGQEYKMPFGRIVSSNITPDPETGIGALTKEQFIGRFKAFAELDPKAPAAPGRNTFMPWRLYAGMTEEDLGAIYVYLRTVKPVKNKVNPFPDAKG